MKRLIASWMVLGLAMALPARAEVQAGAPHGFTAGGAVSIAAPPDAVWAVLVQPSAWWDPDHTWFGRAEGLTLDLRPGGCWCEAGPDGAGAVHMTVTRVVPGETLMLSGALGPLQAEGVAGALTLSLTPEGDGARLTWRYSVGGQAQGGLEAWAPPVDGVLTHQINRLKAAAER